MSKMKSFELECVDIFDRLSEENSMKMALIKYIEYRLQKERETYGTTNTNNEKRDSGETYEQLKLGVD